jgi:adhesin transport system membrane fusion protein
MARRVKRDDLPFMRASEAARHKTGARGAYLLSSAVLLLLGGFLAWADQAEIREVTRAQGSVVPAQRVQVVQNLEGGVLQTLHVEPGARVAAGDPIATLDATIAESSLEELRTDRDAKRAAVARLRAEVADRRPSYPDDLVARAPEIVEDERGLYRARQADLTARVESLTSQARQREQEVSELRDRRGQLTSRLSLARQELNESAPLAEQDLVPRTQMLRLRREVAKLTGELRTVRDSIPRAQTAAEQARQKITRARLAHRRDAAEELTRTLLEMRQLDKRIAARQDRAERRVVTAPVDGRIKELHATTIGGAVKPGADIAEIVPTGDSLLIEARVRPSDIAFIEEGQQALVKITAYDYAEYGGLDGTVETVSADTERTRKGESFYRVHLRTARTALSAGDRSLPVIPGMTVEVEVLGETKTVLDYLTNPLTKGGPGAAAVADQTGPTQLGAARPAAADRARPAE